MRRILITGLALAGLGTSAFAADNSPVKVGVMNDQSSVYADFQGPGSVLAAQIMKDADCLISPVAFGTDSADIALRKCSAGHPMANGDKE